MITNSQQRSAFYGINLPFLLWMEPSDDGEGEEAFRQAGLHNAVMATSPAARLWCRSFSLHRPHQTQGASVYIGTSLPLRYRVMRLLHPTVILRDRSFPIGSPLVATCRAAFVAGEAGDEIEIDDLDLSAYSGQEVYIDVRHCKDDVENESGHPQLLELDGSGDGEAAISGSAALSEWRALAGGVVRFTFAWSPSAGGVQPETFRLVRTAGPSSPANQSVVAFGAGQYAIDSAALLDSATYTFRIEAVNTTHSVTTTLLTVSGVQADASGPPAVTGLTASAV